VVELNSPNNNLADSAWFAVQTLSGMKRSFVVICKTEMLSTSCRPLSGSITGQIEGKKSRYHCLRDTAL
jgi:hypothetical protein